MDVKAELDSLQYAQKERLAYIDFALQYFGQISRADLINHFRTGLASCTRDLTLYRNLAPNNLILRHETKLYYRTIQFLPIFEHNPEATLNNLCGGFGDGFSNGVTPSDVCIDATRLIHPNTDVIATIMRAIVNRRAVSCEYISLTSGESKREIVPHAIANNGQRWLVRAFDIKSKKFRDFACTRLQNITEMNQPIATIQAREYDTAWQNIVEVKLTVHPSVTYFKAIELDFDMVDGLLYLEVREALLGHLMRHWNVDCSLEGKLVGEQYQLRLDNINEFQGIEYLSMAPDY